MAKKKRGSRGGGKESKTNGAPKPSAEEASAEETGSESESEKETGSATEAESSKKTEPENETEPESKTASEPEKERESESDEDADSETLAAREEEADAPSRARSLHSGSDLGNVAGAAWARPLYKLEKAWTWFESRLLVVVLLSLIAAMVAWVALKGLHQPVPVDANGNTTISYYEAGTAFRALAGFAILGGIARLVTRRQPETTRTYVTLAAVLFGIFGAALWRKTGVLYAEHMLNWLQEGSSLTMFGGLRGIAASLTILLALIGASLAAAGGKHINIDVLLRFFPGSLRTVVFLMSTIATASVCFTVGWAFLDEIAITEFGADKDAPPGQHVAKVTKSLGDDLFIWRKQIGLDFSALPHVVAGGRWDDESRMNGRQWNAFVEEGGFRDHYTKEQVDSILAPPDALEESRIPMVIVPDGSARGLLVRSMHLTFTIGFIIIGLRFILRMLLVLAGYASVDPEPDEFEGAKAAGQEALAMAKELADGDSGADEKEAA